MTRAVHITHETPAHRIIVCGDGIVRVYAKPSHIDEVDIINLSKKYTEIRNGGELLKVILDPTEENSMSKEARKAVENEMRKNCLCIAVISRKTHVRILGNYFLKIKDLGFHLKLFSNEEQAVTWLKTFNVP